MPIFVHSTHHYSSICRPIENGAFRCDPVESDAGRLAAGVIMGALLLVVFGGLLWIWWDDRRWARRYAKAKAKLEEDLKKPASERMP